MEKVRKKAAKSSYSLSTENRIGKEWESREE